MADIRLNQIQTFYLVAKHGSFSGAARLLNISYQSVANHIRRLEQVMGEGLVVAGRGTRSIALTPRGRSLFRLLEPELNIMLDRLSEVVEKQRPILRIGLPQAVLYYLFPPALERFHAEHPEVQFLTFERDTVLADLLASGSLDVAMSERFFGDPAIVQRLLGTYHVSLILPQPWDPPESLEAIPQWAQDKPFVTYEPGQTLRNESLDFLSVEGRIPDIFMSASSTSCVKRFVAAGMGFSIVPSWALDAADATMRTMELRNLPETKLYFCHAQFLVGNDYVQSLYEACRATFPDERA
jgi:LysR family transcriptional regulator, low CO2-responsive transcriptional regulator